LEFGIWSLFGIWDLEFGISRQDLVDLPATIAPLRASIILTAALHLDGRR
jgi:hypothetical protein